LGKLQASSGLTSHAFNRSAMACITTSKTAVVYRLASCNAGGFCRSLSC
jgi:hypothetical protein